MAAGRGAIVQGIERRVDDLARTMLDTIVDEVPLYRHLPREQLDGEVLEVCRTNLRVFLRSLRRGTRPDPRELAAMAASAARRAEERIPLDAVLAAYHVGGRVAWDALQADATPAEQGRLLALAGDVMAYVQTVTGVVAAAYLEEQQTIYGEEREARRALVDALLAGDPAEALAERVGVRPASGYLVLAIEAGRGDGEGGTTGVSAAVTARRRVRRIEEALALTCGDDALCSLHGGGGVVLVPVEPDQAAERLAHADELLGDLRGGSEELWAGVAWREGPAGVPAAAAEARDVARLVVELGRAPGTYRIDDVLLEYALSRPVPARERLARLLEPLGSGPDLLATLEGWFDADFDRRRAAAALHVHPNTLDYRLRRVGELTGLDPASAHGLQLLGAAVVASRLERL